MPDPRTLTLSPNAAAVELRLQGDALVTTVSGRWALDGGAPLFAPLADAALAAADSAGAAPDAPDAPRVPIKRIGFDAATLDAWDSSLLVFLRQGQAYGAAHDCAVDTTGLPTRIITLNWPQVASMEKRNG